MTGHCEVRHQMLIRTSKHACYVMLRNGLTLELTFGSGETRGVWLIGDRFLFDVVAGAA